MIGSIHMYFNSQYWDRDIPEDLRRLIFQVFKQKAVDVEVPSELFRREKSEEEAGNIKDIIPVGTGQNVFQEITGVIESVISSQYAGIDVTTDADAKWQKIGSKWFEMLVQAANNCRGNDHAQQLRRGGEFLTHVWLLMAYFGLTDHSVISKEPRPIARLFTRQPTSTNYKYGIVCLFFGFI
ncbi:hypothetical protein Ddye_012679 [Dipteronia dyeriana]|uniref:Uncharacterized protein n=1 Tax=Dipteronia dyeriana TaxID=168575 RepID=A0AAD9X4P5_9ROSI|nr:hypothetical protein Ddye_012627 [Dipteronia dyeriana]KAK2652823.1 hypothetical protein Ddye_012679 [Dipteronia dyeriana]